MAEEKDKKIDVCSPDLDSPKEEKVMFVGILDNYIKEYEKNIPKS